MRALLLACLAGLAQPALAAPIAKAEDGPGALGRYLALGPGERADSIAAFLGGLPPADDLIRLDLCLTRKAGEPAGSQASLAGALGSCLLEAKQ